MLGGVRRELLEERERLNSVGEKSEAQRWGEGRDCRLGKEACLSFLISQHGNRNSTLLPRFVRIKLIHIKHLESCLARGKCLVRALICVRKKWEQKVREVDCGKIGERPR